MPSRSSTPVASRIRVAILVMVAALCVVPALVRATFSGAPTTPIRLNRGFELPPAKSTLPPPQTVAVTAVRPDRAEPVTRERLSQNPGEIRLVARHEYAPDPLRGPPILPID
jgi:hypothetical protein